MKAFNILGIEGAKKVECREDQDVNPITFTPHKVTKVQAFNRFKGQTAVYTYQNETLAKLFVERSRGNKYFVFSLIE